MAKPSWALTENEKKSKMSDTTLENKYLPKVQNKYLVKEVKAPTKGPSLIPQVKPKEDKRNTKLVNGRTVIKSDKERISNKALEIAQEEKPAFMRGFEDSASLGIMKTGNQELYARKQQENKLGYGAGQVAGYLIPGGASYAKLGKPIEQAVIKKGGSKLLSQVLGGAAAGAAVDTAEGVIAGDDAKNLAKRVGTGALFGAGADVGLNLVGKGIKALKPKLVKEVVEQGKKISPQVKVTVKKQRNNLIPLKGNSFEIKNTQLEQAKKTYDEAIEQIQNKFGTNQLTPDEVARIKPEMGIDLDKLTSDIEKAEKGINLKPTLEKNKLAYAAGVKDVPKKNLYKNINEINAQGKISNKVLTPNIETNVKPLNEAAATVEAKIDNNGIERTTQKIVSSDKQKTSIGQRIEQAYTRIVDSNKPLRKVNEATYIKGTNSKNVSGVVSNIFTGELVDRQGKRISSSLKEIAESIPQDEYTDFWEYALQRHNVSRANQGKNIFPDFDSAKSLKTAQEWERLHPEWKDKASSITKWIDDFMQEWGVKAGVIDEDLYKGLRETYPDYLPTHRDFEDLEEFVPTATNGKGFVGQNVPLKKATGSDRDIKDPLESIMNLVNRTVRIAKYNEVGQSLLDAVRKSPEKLKPLAEVLTEKPDINLKNVVTVLEGGKPVVLEINDAELLKSLQGVYKNVEGFEAIGKITNLFKSLITQKNPVFTVRNFFRDLPTAYVFGSEKNPVKFAKDYLSAVKDIKNNTDIVKQYKGMGGMASNFSFDTKDMGKTAKSLLKKDNVLGKVEKINNIVESAPRLAEFKRTLEKTGDLEKALNAAADVTTNFSRGGDITKKYDRLVPYLNAGVQGLDKLARELNPKNPKHLMEVLAKGGMSIALPSYALHIINKDNENYKMLDNRTKDNNFLIPNGDTFIKIPKSRELGVLFGVLAERTLRAIDGEDEAFKGLLGTMGDNFGPANPVSDNILAPLIFHIPRNKDFADRSIVPENMKDRSPEHQYDEQTSEIAKEIGKLTKKSPKQVDYLIRSYTGVIGQLLIPASTKATYQGGTPGEKILRPITSQFKADPLYNNSAISTFYENYDKLKTKAADKNFADNVPSKTVTQEEDLRNFFAKTSKQISDITKLIKEAEKTGDKAKVRELRLEMIRIAGWANKQVR